MQGILLYKLSYWIFLLLTLQTRQVFTALSSFLTDLDMIVIAHSDTLQPVPMSQMTLEALNQAVMNKWRSESQALFGDEHLNV